MNQGLRDVIQREDLLKMQELDKNGQIRCKDLDCLKNIESTLNGKVNSASAREMEVNDQKEHFKRSSDDFEHVSDINIGMSEETFLAIQFFCRGDRLMQQHSFGYHDGMLQINCKDKDEKDNLETSIESKLKHLEVMNKDDVSFTTAEKPKIRGTIDQIHKDVEGVYCYLLKEDEHSVVHVMAQNYSQLQTAKHKILLGIGRIKQTETRRNRRFDNTTPQQGERTLTETKKFSQSYHGSRASWQPPQPTFGYGSVTPTDFTTAEGLLVKVYSGSILHLDVDCIVNAANGDLQHGGGVARVISDAAGYEFDKESRDYIYSHGPLRVGEVCTTSAGNLKYKGVIHAVGPRWYDYSQDQKRDCLCDLKEAVKNSLEEADFQRYKSIAIPAISSGKL
ncbi:uncharacterized protein [Argopecten irradians]|uniref:uncharacterized protein n=1 Tax=Argopecten irradians TaxID=31199 RepID=UPI003719C03A